MLAFIRQWVEQTDAVLQTLQQQQKAISASVQQRQKHEADIATRVTTPTIVIFLLYFH